MFSACSKEETGRLAQVTDENLVIAEDQSGEIIEGQYVVVLNETSFKAASSLSYDEKLQEVKTFAESMIRTKSSGDFEVGNAFAEAIKGFSVKMSKEDVAKLEMDSRVKYILPDRMYIMKKPVPTDPPVDPPADDQVVPYGIARVGYGNGVGKTAWILDTGIDYDHPDLNVDVARGRTFVRSKSADDDNGHGTHCSGTVAAIDNNIGVVGVAAGATVVPVKVLDRRGSGAYSGIISGIDYVASAASAGDAANMSLGGGVYQAIDDAVYAASQKGIHFALAAGNESDDANNHSPARVNGPNIFTISAMDINDNWAYFSNYGNPPVDYCEPGYNIYSTAKGGGYTTMSGTSMAAPHMCGILLMTNGNPGRDGTVNGDPDGNADPIGTI
jgi:subtilisin family serine protease